VLEATKLLNVSRAQFDGLDRHIHERELYVRRMLELAVARKPIHERDDRVAREAFVALAELSEVRTRWKIALAALEQLAAAAEHSLAKKP
jgi:hypothetical protein